MGVRRDSPSRGDINWLSTRPSRLIDKRWQLGCVSRQFRQVRLSRTPVWCLSEACSTREPGDHVAESLIGCHSTRKRVAARTVGIRRGWREARSSTSQGGTKPLCARIKRENREFFWERKLISEYGQISYYESQPRAASGALNGRMLARASQLIKASTPTDLGTPVFLFLHDVTFEKRGFGGRNRSESGLFLLCCC